MGNVSAPFYVMNYDHQLVPAKFLVDFNGNPVTNPNSSANTVSRQEYNKYYDINRNIIENLNPNNYLVVPIDYDLQRAEQFIQEVNSASDYSTAAGVVTMATAFFGEGSQNLQRTYENNNGSETVAGSSVPMFQDAASFHLGIVSQMTGFTAVAQIFGSIYEIRPYVSGPLDFGAAWDNNSRNMGSISAGAAFIQNQTNTYQQKGAATIDDSSNGAIPFNTPTTAATSLAQDIFPIPAGQSAGDPQLPDDPELEARSALADALAQQLEGHSGVFQAFRGDDGTILIKGDDGTTIRLNEDFSGIKTSPANDNESFISVAFDSNGSTQSTFQFHPVEGNDGQGQSNGVGYSTFFDSQGNAEGSNSSTYTINGQGIPTLVESVALASDGTTTYTRVDGSIGTTVSTDVNGYVIGVTVTNSGQVGTTTNAYDQNGLLTSTISTGPGGKTVTSYSDPSDLNVKTVLYLNPDGNVIKAVDTARNADGTYETSLRDNDGQIIGTPQKSTALVLTPLAMENGVLDALNIVSAIQNGRPLLAADAALKLATLLSGNNRVLSETSLGVDGLNEAISLIQNLRDGNLLEGIRSGAYLLSDAIAALGNAGAGAQLGAAASYISIGVDLAEHNYKDAAINAIMLSQPELGAALKIIELLYALFGSKSQYIEVPADISSMSISLTDDPADTVQFDSGPADANRTVHIDVGSGNNILNIGEGVVTLHAGSKMGQDTVSITSPNGGNTLGLKVLEFDSQIPTSYVRMERQGNDMIFHVGSYGQSITVSQWFDANHRGVDEVRFADGTVWHVGSDENLATFQTSQGGNSKLIASAGYGNVILTPFASEVQIEDGAKAIVLGGAGSDIINVGLNTQVQIATQDGNDTIKFNTGWNHASIDLGTGNNHVRMNLDIPLDSHTRIELGSGNNFIAENGWNNADYFVSETLGHDTVSVTEMDGHILPTSNKTVHFEGGITQADLVLTRSGNDLVMSLGVGKGDLTISDWFKYADVRIGNFVFSDGSSFTSDSLKSVLIPYHGSGDLEGWDGNDDIYAGDTASNLVTNGGSDRLHGGSGNDTFTITDFTNSAEIFCGNGNDQITLGWADIANVHLGGGQTDVHMQNTNGQVNVFGSTGQTHIFADDVGFSATTVINTGSGAIDISGKAETIEVNYKVNSGLLTLEGGNGAYRSIGQINIGPGISREDVFVRKNGNDLWISLKNQDAIRIESFFADDSHHYGSLCLTDGTVIDIPTIQAVLATSNGAQVTWNEFAGTAGNDSLAGSSISEIFDGHGGNDTVSVGGGTDTIIFNQGYGALEVYSAFAQDERYVLQLGTGIGLDNLVVTKTEDATGIVLTDGISGDEVVLDNFFWFNDSSQASVRLNDGTTLNASQLLQMSRTILGTTGSDSIDGTSGIDFIDGMGGFDVITGNGGSDTFVFNKGYGSLEIVSSYVDGDVPVLQFGAGITAATLSVRATDDGSGLVLSDGVTGDSITIDNMISGTDYGVLKVQFADGTSLSATQLMRMETTGTGGSEHLYGTSHADLFDGKGGNDVESGGGGNDTFVYNAGYGKLEIDESDSYSKRNNVLQLGSGITSANLHVGHDSTGSSLVLTDGTAGDVVTIDSMLTSATAGVQSVQFADGTVLTRAQLIQMETTGSSGTETLYGTSGGEVFDGHGGNDVEVGRGGNDTFVFNQGYGKLEISESDPSSKRNNVLKLGAGITASSLVVNHTSDGTGVVLTDGISGDQITIDSMVSTASAGIQTIAFADGSTLTRAALLAMATTGTAGADSLYGTSGADVIDGKGGTDMLKGNGGADTYMLSPSYGALTVVNGVSNKNTAAGTLLINGENPNNIWLRQVGKDLEIDVMGTKTSATIQGWYSHTYSQLSAVSVQGGSGGNETLDKQLSQLVQAMANYSSSHAGFDPTSSANPQITDSNLLASVSSAWHQTAS